jgi:hypothetical protein
MIGVSIYPRSAEVESKAQARRIIVRVWIRGRNNDAHRPLCKLSLQVGRGGGLSIDLVLELADGTLLGLELPFELSDLLPLGFDKAVQTAGLGIALIAGTFPGDLRSSRSSRQSWQQES